MEDRAAWLLNFEADVELGAGASFTKSRDLARLVASLRTRHGAQLLRGGDVEIDECVDLAPEDRGVAMLFQGGALWPHLSVAKTLGFVLARCGTKGASAKARIATLLNPRLLSMLRPASNSARPQPRP